MWKCDVILIYDFLREKIDLIKNKLIIPLIVMSIEEVNGCMWCVNKDSGDSSHNSEAVTIITIMVTITTT